MQIQVEEPLRRVRLSWEEFLELPEWPRAEWVDGEAVLLVTPPRFSHGASVVRLAATLMALFPRFALSTEAFLVLPRNRVRLPDLMMVERAPADGWVRTPPVLVVEVLSPSTRAEDTIRKSSDYASGGVGQYWVVDPDLRTVDLWRNVAGEWESIGRIDEGHPNVEVTLAGVAVPLDLAELLDP